MIKITGLTSEQQRLIEEELSVKNLGELWIDLSRLSWEECKNAHQMTDKQLLNVRDAVNRSFNMETAVRQTHGLVKRV